MPRGSTILLLAEPGNALSLFCEQFAGGGLAIGDPVTYAVFDRPARYAHERILSFKQGNGRSHELVLHDGYSSQFAMGRGRSGFDIATPLRREDAFNVLMKSAVGGGPTHRLVIESLSGLTRPDNEASVLEFIRNVTYVGHECEGLTLVSLVKGLHSDAFETELKHLATGVLEVGAERKGFGIYSYLIVSKMLNIRDPLRLLLFKETDKGLWLESTKRVF